MWYATAEAFLRQCWVWRYRLTGLYVASLALLLVYLFLLAEEKYQVAIAIEPGKVLMPGSIKESDTGELIDHPKSMHERISIGLYDDRVIDDLGLSADVVFNWIVSQPRDTNLVYVAIRWADVAQATQILSTLVRHMSADLKGRADVYRGKLGLSKQVYADEILETQRKVDVVEQELTILRGERVSIREHTSRLRDSQLEALSNRRDEASPDIQSALIFNSLIQDNMLKAVEAAGTINNLELKLRDLHLGRDVASSQLQEVELLLANVVEIEELGGVSVSAEPVEPRKLVVLASVMVLLFIASMLFVQVMLIIRQIRDAD